MRFRRHTRQNERGQTILLVAVAMVLVLGLAALAIDVVTLYVASGEIQRAADAAAIAGAKVFVDTGVTTDPSNATLQALAQNTATSVITATVTQNIVSGAAPTLNGAPVFDFTTHPGDPQVTVNLARTNLPTFFSKIWGYQLATVRATAVAEAYNPAYAQLGGVTSTVPIQPKCVKPWLVPNADPTNPGNPLLIIANGSVVNPGVINPTTMVTFRSACDPAATCAGVVGTTPAAGKYVPAVVTAGTGNLCPTCAGGSNFEQAVSCCDTTTVYTCGGTTPNTQIDFTANPGTNGDTQNGTQCLIHSSGSGPFLGQDVLNPGDQVTKISTITAGSSNPLVQGGGAKLKLGDNITTSNSIVTLPIYDSSTPIPVSGQVTIIGFLQLFIDDINANTIDAHILNVAGCGALVSSPAITQGSSVAIPVRLIHQ